jgi:hypothetical protein
MLQLSLILAATLAILLALTGVLPPAGAAPPDPPAAGLGPISSH